MAFSACEVTLEESNTSQENNNQQTEVNDTNNGPSSVAFAELEQDILSAAKEFKLFRFTEPEGTCMEMGFPENLVYMSTNRIQTEDESYFDQSTIIDFTGLIRFKGVPLNDDVNASCKIKTTRGINTANLTCSTLEGEEETEVCTGSFKIVAEK